MLQEFNSVAVVLISVLGIVLFCFLPFTVIDVFKWMVIKILPSRFRYGRMWSVLHSYQKKKSNTLPAVLIKPSKTNTVFGYQISALLEVIHHYYYYQEDYIKLISLIAKFASWANDDEKQEILRLIIKLRETVPSVKNAFYSFNQKEIEKILSYDALSLFSFLRLLKQIKHPMDLNP